jgi:uncharacterized protein YecE (DUF72 family)
VSAAEIVVGTSGFQYRDWVGELYPEGTKPRDMLARYAETFSAVEINFTYYGLPRPSQMKRMADVTPEGFEFVVKAHRTTTHEGKLDDARPLLEGLAPVREAGKLSGVLCQFPWRFKNTKENRAYLARVRGELGDVPVFVEFRHASWIGEPVFEFLAKQRLLYVSVDEPELPGLVPRIGRLTGEAGYVRFHSRNKSTWWQGGGKARYDYDYSDGELAEWLPVLEELAASARKVFVFFNNCHRGQAARNAVSMRDILRKAGLIT